MLNGKTYTIKGSRLSQAFKSNMKIRDDRLFFDNNSSLYVLSIDSMVNHGTWGKLHIDYELFGNAVITVRVMASDDLYINNGNEKMSTDEFLKSDVISNSVKDKAFLMSDCISKENQSDILLYSLKGRYLWIGINISVKENGSGNINLIKVYEKGDNFLDTFPEIYREEDSFFHRYISIFSSMYNELQENIEKFPDKFDIDNASYEMLLVFIKWLGIDVRGEFLDNNQLRMLVKEAYELNKRKGTKKALERAAEIVLGEKAAIKEKSDSEKNGQSDITVLISTDIEQSKKAGVIYLLEQFKPVKSSMKVIFLRKDSKIDDNTYMDMNAVIIDGKNKKLDSKDNYENIILQ